MPKCTSPAYRVLSYEESSEEGVVFDEKAKALAFASSKANADGAAYVIWKSVLTQQAGRRDVSSIECLPDGVAIEFDHSSLHRRNPSAGKYLRGYGKQSRAPLGKRPREK